METLPVIFAIRLQVVFSQSFQYRLEARGRETLWFRDVVNESLPHDLDGSWMDAPRSLPVCVCVCMCVIDFLSNNRLNVSEGNGHF